MANSGVKFGISPVVVEYEPRGILERVPLYEDAGFDALWEGDHILPWHHTGGHCTSAAVMATGYLERSKRVEVIYGVVAPLGLRIHPVDLAMQTATMACIHPGRAALCVGTGEAMNDKSVTGLWPPNGERVARVEEAIKLIKQYWESKDYFTFKGKYFRTQALYLYDKPTKAPPIYCAAGGPIMARIAGKYCDGMLALGPPNYFKDVLFPAFDAGAREAKKDPNSLVKAAFIDTSYHPDIKKAMASARMYGGVLIPECYHLIQDPRTIEQRSQLVRDEVLDAVFNIGSKAETLIEKFDAYRKVGVNHLVWAEISPDPNLSIKICKDEVIPYFRKT
ncbi:MAG: LLM class flavin-dependent oxidoreductase [Candidatus Bathyarchaeia archaeon]